MKTKVAFIICLFISFYTFTFLVNNVSRNLPSPKSIAGTLDNPYGVLKFRYDMIKGKAKFIDVKSRRRAIEYVKENFPKPLKKSEGISSWTNLGPGNIGGRIRSIIVRPSNSSQILVGAVAGGIWKTTDGGTNWTPKNDDGDPISIGCMANDGDVVYAGTGEGWGNIDAVYGGGIWKSTDFGDTWTLLSNTTNWNFKNVKQLRIDPSHNIYAVTKAFNYKGGVGGYYTNGGLYKSTDGGTNWNKISTTSINYYYNGTDVIPISSSVILFATDGGGIYKTTDGGSNWSHITSGLPTDYFNRIAMAQDPNTSTTVYAVFSSETYDSPYYGLRGIYKSTNSGTDWSELTRPGRLSSTDNLTYLSKQGWYGNTIAVDSHNSNNIYLGGVDDMKSTDGGSSWKQLTYWDTYYGTPYVHADHHAIVFDPNTANIVYDGNDGGIFKTTDGGSNWNSLNYNLEVTQFYGGATAKSSAVYAGGTQDNGHLKYSSGTSWAEIYGGDGGYAAIDQNNSDVLYEEYVYLDMHKTTNGGTNWNSCTNGLSDAGNGNYCLFIAPFAMDPENSNVLIAGSDNVWLTTDAASNWKSSSGTLSSGEKVSAVTIVKSSSPYLGFAGTTDGKVFVCTSMTGSSDTWTDISPAGNNGAWVRRITVDLNDYNKIYICYSGYNNDGVTPTKHVWYSSNQGSSWSDISGNLPDAPVHSLVVDPINSQTLYLGTEVGVFETTDRGGTWSRKGVGMPDYAPVDELVIQSGTNKLFAFTHGRSAFVTTSALPVELTSFNAIVNNEVVKLFWQTATEVNNYGFEIDRRSSTSQNSSTSGWEKIGFVKGSGNSNSLKQYSFTDVANRAGKYYYKLKQIDVDGNSTYSNIIEVNIKAPCKFILAQNYPNPFGGKTVSGVSFTKIKYSVPSNASVSLKVFDVLGREVATLINDDLEKGNYQAEFKAMNLPSGTYFYRLMAKGKFGKFSQTKKMVYLR